MLKTKQTYAYLIIIFKNRDKTRII